MNHHRSSMLKYSLSVGFVTTASIFGISNLASTRYLADEQKFGLYLVFFIFLLASFGFLSNITINGLFLVEDFQEYHPLMEKLLTITFGLGMYAFFISLIMYLPTYILMTSLQPAVSSTTSWRIGLFWVLTSLLFLVRIFGGGFRKMMRNIKIPNRKDIKKELITFSVILILSLASLSGTIKLCSSTYVIEIEKGYHRIDGQYVCIVEITALGYASIDDAGDAKIWIKKESWEEMTLHEINKGTYYTLIDLTECESGVYHLRFQSPGPGGNPFRKDSIIVIEESPLIWNNSSAALSVPLTH